MTDVATLIDALIDREGGYVDHPADRGGATHWGITQAVARAHGYAGEIRALPRDFAVRIYRELYWSTPQFDRIAALSPIIAAELFDTGVNMGPVAAVRFLQRALNALNRNGRDYADIVIDGAVGPVTVQALRQYREARGKAGERVLLKAIDALQGERYIALAEARPANEAFVYGWLANRLG
ncbi:MAG: glycosyl hydrolase 108 family protein [Sphingobium sp.]